MILAVVGSRAFRDYSRLRAVLDEMQPTSLVSGGASGADKLAERYAKEMGIPICIIPADWERHGKAAGIIRNKEIVSRCDSLVAFWDGSSRGTANSIERAVHSGKPVRIENFQLST